MGDRPSKSQKLSDLPPDNMKLTSGVGLLLVLILVISLLISEAESRSLRPHRGPLARRAQATGYNGLRTKSARRKGNRKGKYSRRGKHGRRGGRNGDIPDADVITDETSAADPGTEGGEDVCEVLMFDRGDGTYSLKFIKNKC